MSLFESTLNLTCDAVYSDILEVDVTANIEAINVEVFDSTLSMSHTVVSIPVDVLSSRYEIECVVESTSTTDVEYVANTVLETQAVLISITDFIIDRYTPNGLLS